MPQENLRTSRSDRESTPYLKRRVVAAVLAGVAVLGAGKVTEAIASNHTEQEQDLQSDTASYTVDESGYLWNVANGLDVEDATYASKILEDLNPEYEGKIVPQGTVLEVPSDYLDSE